MSNNHPEANISDMFQQSENISILGKEWADKNHAASMLEETKAIIRQEIANRIRSQSPLMSKRDSELAALVSPEYKEHVIAMVAARTASNIARINLESARTQFDATRTAEVSRRAELSRIQGN